MDWVWAEASLLAMAWLVWGGILTRSPERGRAQFAARLAPWVLVVAGMAVGPWGFRGSTVVLGLWVLAVASAGRALRDGPATAVAGAVAVVTAAALTSVVANWPVLAASVAAGCVLGALGGSPRRGAALAALATAGAGILRPEAFQGPGQAWLWAVWSTGLGWVAGHLVARAGWGPVERSVQSGEGP